MIRPLRGPVFSLLADSSYNEISCSSGFGFHVELGYYF